MHSKSIEDRAGAGAGKASLYLLLDNSWRLLSLSAGKCCVALLTVVHAGANLANLQMLLG